MLKLTKSVIKIDGGSDELFALAEAANVMAEDAKLNSDCIDHAFPLRRAYFFLSNFLDFFGFCTYNAAIIKEKEEEEKNVQS